MQERNGARELGLVTAALVVLIHFLDGVAFWVATGLIVAAVLAATARLAGRRRPWYVPPDRYVLPALAAFAAAGLAQLVNPVPWLGIVFVGTWVLMAWIVAVETLPPSGAQAGVAALAGTRGGHPRPLAGRAATLGVAFLAFAAVGGFVPGGLPANASTPTTSVLTGTTVFDLVIGGLTGYLLAAIRPDRVRDLVWAFVLYGLALGAAGALLRLVGMPRLLGPAVLTLLAYLMACFQESAGPIRHNRRLVGETILLGLAGCAVIVLGLLIR
jgi:hypothetical protein